MPKIRAILLTIISVAVLFMGILSVQAALNKNQLIKQDSKSQGVLSDGKKSVESPSTNGKSISSPSKKDQRLLIKYKDNQSAQTLKSSLKKKIKLSKVEIRKQFKRSRMDVIEVDSNADITKVKEELVKDPNVEYVQTDFELGLLGEQQEDEKYSLQWALENDGQDILGQEGTDGVDINVKEAWSKTKGSEDVVIGVIDTAIDINNPEIKDNIFTNPLEIPGNGIDDDNNGYIDDVNGWDFVNDDNSVNDNTSDENHGTHIAGIIGAKEGNGGIKGIAPNVKILPLKFSEDGKGRTSSVIEAIEYAKKMGVRIINCSFGASNYNPALSDEMKSTGILFVCAAGNNGSAEPIYPAAFELPNVLSVAAVDNKGGLASFSNYNESVDVAAPGVKILSIAANNGYDYYSGTSSAAPQVTGMAALLESYRQSLMPNDIALTIKANAEKSVTDTNIKLANVSEAFDNIKIYSNGAELPVEDSNKKIYDDQELEMLTAGVSKLLVEQLHYGEDGVSAASGNFSRSYVDMSLESPIYGIAVTRTYNSMEVGNYSYFGAGWTFSYSGNITNDDTYSGRVNVMLPGGVRENFVAYGPNTYVSDISNGSKGSILTVENGAYKLTTKDQHVYYFNSNGYLCKIEDENKNAITIEFGAGKIKSVTDQQGRKFEISYNSIGYVDRITDTSNNRVVTYSYENYRLKSVIDPMNNTIYTYTYDSNGLLSSVKDYSGNTIETITYNSGTTGNKGIVYQNTKYITPQKSNTYTYRYNTSNKTTTITDSNNRVVTKKYDDYQFITSSVDPEGKETKVEYSTSNPFSWNLTDGHYPRNYKPWALSRSNAAIAEYNGKIYYFGGQYYNTEWLYYSSPYSYSCSIYPLSLASASSFDSSTQTWSNFNLPSYFPNGYSQASATVKNGEIYVAGGKSIQKYTLDNYEVGLKSMYKFNPANNVWTKMPDMPHIRYGHELAALDNDLYAIGGQVDNAYNASNLVEKFDGTRWTEVSSTLAPCNALDYGRISAVLGGKLYVRDKNGNLELYDHVNDQWSIFDTNVPVGEMVVANNTIYSVNGRYQTAYKYDINKKCWELMSSSIGIDYNVDVRQAYFNSFRAAVSNGNIYTICGYTTWHSATYNPNTEMAEVFAYLEEPNLYVYQGNYTTTKQVNYYGEEKKVTDRSGNVYQYERDKRGNITKTINPDGSCEEYTYDSKNNILSEKDAEGKYTFYVYDADGINLLKTAAPLNGTDIYIEGQSDTSKFTITQYVYYSEEERAEKGYTIKGLLKTKIDPNGNSTEYTYDANGNVSTATDAEGNVSKSEYYSTGLIKSAITPKGFRNDYNYDHNGRLEKTVCNGTETTRTTYDAMGRKTQEVLPKQYDESLDNLSTHTYSGNHGTRYTYYSSGKVRTETDAENNTTTYDDYDQYGNLKKETKPNGAIFEYEYDIMNRLSKVYYTDKAGAAKKLLEEYTYNILSGGKTQKIQKTYENSTKAITITYTYDYAGRQIEQLNGDGTKITNEYYKDGEIKSATDPKGNKTEYIYNQIEGSDKYDIVKTPFEEINEVTHYTVSKTYYDKNGNVTKTTVTSNKPGEPEKVKETRYEYDKTNKLIKVTSYNNGAVENIFQYYYDADGNKLRMYQGLTSPLTINGLDSVVPGGDSTYTVTKYDYDTNNRLSKVTDSTGKEDLYDSYDLNGNLTHRTDRNGSSIAMTYDNLNRPKTETVTTADGKGNVSTTYSYDDINRKVTKTINGETTTLEYDGKGNLLKETVRGSITKQYTYNDNGTRSTFVSQQGTETINDSAYEYDNMGRLRNVKEDGQQVAQYTYDQNGNRSSITYGNNVTVDYTYNLGNRIKTLVNKNADGTALSQFSYTYYLDANEATKTDPQGETAYEYDGLGRLKTTAEPGNVQRAYTYDDRNNRSSVTTSGPLYENTEDMSYEYDGLNRLTKATGSHTATYQYDADGIRQSKTVDGLTTTHVLDGTDVAADITGADKTEYVRGINLICMKKNGQMYYYLFDAHGNVVQMVDQNGNIVNNYTYDEWGNTKSQTEGIENPFKYCGEYFDKETGLYYLRARYYDPTIGRFISEDSEWGKDNDPLSLNLYTYCQNDPVRYMDPSGHWLTASQIASTLGKYVEAGIAAGEFIIEAGVTGYTVLKRVTPLGVATWVLFKPTSTATTKYEQAEIKKWAEQHKNEISPKPPKPPKPTLAERITLITAACSKIKDNIKSWGLEAYKDMTILLKNTGLQAHHIIEKRFAPLLGIKNTDIMYSMAVTPQQHQLFTNAWRTAIPYGTTPTNMMDVYNTALKIYKDFPEIIKIINRAIELQSK